MWTEILVLALSLPVLFWASSRFTVSLERVGAHWNFPEGLLGIVTALGADAPEISSAVTALLAGQREVGLGVVLGSNIFNLAGLLGLSAVLAGRVSIGRRGLLFNGGTSLLVTVVALLLVLQLTGVGLSLGLLVALLAPYMLLCSLRSEHIRRLPVPAKVRNYLDAATGHLHRRRPALT